MKKNVWVLNHYAGEMYLDRGGRHYGLTKHLRVAGYIPVVFCSNAVHGKPKLYFDTERLWEMHMAEDIQVPFVFVKSRTYMGNGRQRILNMVDFYRNVKKTAKEYAAQNGKPDVIYASSVHPLTLVAGIQLAKHFGVECICEVRDLWPESIVAYSGRLKKTNPIIQLLYQGEKWIYRKADKLIFTMEGAYDYIANQGWSGEIPKGKVYHINNGVDLSVFDSNREMYSFSDKDLDDPDLLTAVYAGSIRRVNNVGQLLDAAKKIENPNIRLLIWGNGDELEPLKQRVAAEHIDNVVFKGRVDKKYIPSIVSRSAVNIVHWEMSEILKYGESYNKLFEYLAAGRPIFSTVRPEYSIVEKYRCGKDTDGFTATDFAEGISGLLEASNEKHMEMGQNARDAAAEFDFYNLTQKLIQIIEK